MNKKIIWLVVILILGFVAYKMFKPQKYAEDNGDDNQLDDGVLDDSGGAQARY
jgi:hypothetical protein